MPEPTSTHERAPASSSDSEEATATRARPRTLHGIGVVPGIAIGPAYVYTREAVDVEQRRVDADAVEEEAQRFETAVRRSERDLNKIIAMAREKLGDGSAGIFEAQHLMLRDEAVYEAVQERIREERENADYAVQQVMGYHRRRMEASGSQYMRERGSDLTDVQDRLVRHLRRGKLLSAIQPNTIVAAETLTAADLLLFSRHGILGCAMDQGGATSHVSIMARTLDLPTVVSRQGVCEAVRNGTRVIVDGAQGRLLVDPTEEQLADYRERQAQYEQLRSEQKELAPLPSKTQDGHPVTLRANVEFEQEIDLLEEHGADGIGLFRTEMLLLMRGRRALSEELTYSTYTSVVEAVKPAVTTFRMLDLGGDKLLPLAHREHNPFLGWRGIRILLDKPGVLRQQLRAVLRASAHGPIRILLPMITHLDEIARFRQVQAEVEEKLREEGHAFAEQIPLGIMVEVPAVALMAGRFARAVDFFSIGTNDLTQYVLAVDRGNELVASSYSELHPAVLALLQRTVRAAHAEGLPVSLCGEMAANLRATPLLVGLGLDELSATPTQLPGVKRVVRALRRDEAEALAEEALCAADATAVRALVEEWLAEHAPDVMRYLTVA